MSNRTWTWIVIACTFALTVIVLAILNTWMIG